ncbi:MAG: DUF1329 domain-containing protein [Deltaproteobacteria bacterium]|nr:DUF1329 domain-containing protein [Deltaproteobacteria bacterium]
MMAQACKQKIMILLSIAAAVLVMTSVSAGAAEVTFPVAAYTPEELSKVRAWEKIWAGKKIDKNNIDQVAEFMPAAYVEIYKNPDKWGGPPEGNYFTIVPYRRIVETRGMIAATKKYAPLVKVDAAGRITNYADIAGFPFPDPRTGLEIAYNMECQSRGDTYEMRWKGGVITPRTRTERNSNQLFKEMYFVHRVDTEPLPAILKNPKGIHKAQFLHFDLPPEMNNSRLIVMKYIDDSKDYASYLYYSQFRRIKRLSQAERTNAIDGQDQIYDDGNMFDGYINRNTYTYKGKKELLLARHQDINDIIHVAGEALSSGYTFERCNTYVVEVVNKDPDYIYSKRIWYLDPETYMIHWQEMYDSVGRYWKCFNQPTSNIKTAKGEMKNFMAAYIMQDMQRRHSGQTKMHIRGIGKKMSPRQFSLSNLQKTY